MLRRLAARWASTQVIATPHMRPGMFDNEQDPSLKAAFESRAALRCRPTAYQSCRTCPASTTSTTWCMSGLRLRRKGLPYPGGARRACSSSTIKIFQTACCTGSSICDGDGSLLPVIAHPERYRPIWSDPDKLERMIEGGAAALLGYRGARG